MTSNSEKSNPLLTELVQSNDKFARDIYRILAEKNQDVLFSPISLQVVLLMAFTGTRGKTEQEMKIGLHLSKDKSKILQGVRLLLDSLEGPNLKIASQIFVDQAYNFREKYKNLLVQYFKSSLTTVDFVRSPDEAVATINSWIAKKTEGKISDIVSPEAVNILTRLILVNGVHFKDEWQRKFSSFSTRNEPFYSAKDSYADIPMMHSYEYLKYSDEESYEVLEIPYKKAGFRMVILLPKQIDGLHQLEEKLEEIVLGDIFDHLETRRFVQLALPKFKMERVIKMTDVLKKLGMKTMFDENAADFSEVFCIQHRFEGLCVDGVMQSVLLDVNEAGTEAAAVTYASLRGGGSPPPMVEFTVNHPFIFFILHHTTILFMGKKTSP